MRKQIELQLQHVLNVATIVDKQLTKDQAKSLLCVIVSSVRSMRDEILKLNKDDFDELELSETINTMEVLAAAYEVIEYNTPQADADFVDACRYVINDAKTAAQWLKHIENPNEPAIYHSDINIRETSEVFGEFWDGYDKSQDSEFIEVA